MILDVDMFDAWNREIDRRSLRANQPGRDLTNRECEADEPLSCPGDIGRAPGWPDRSGDTAGLAYMFSISTLPKPEHDTCVAPSIRRAKS